jgi:hypothetical protein
MCPGGDAGCEALPLIWAERSDDPVSPYDSIEEVEQLRVEPAIGVVQDLVADVLEAAIHRVTGSELGPPDLRP